MRSIGEWVDYTQTLHSRDIDMQLDRVALVFEKLFPKGISFKTISVAGTNGKGSCVAMLSSILHAQGYSVAKYTSPHLVHFNERFQINGNLVSDQELQNAYQFIESKRGGIALTFFEFATLVAIYLFEQANVDIAVMEVGLGGRLDAVNILDADVAVISNIAFDHTDWLGDTLDKIGREKVGIARPGRACVVGMSNPPSSIIEYCQQTDVKLYCLEKDFSFSVDDEQQQWGWKGNNLEMAGLQLPLNKMLYQLHNASAVIQALQCIDDVLPVEERAYRQGIAQAALLGRCQTIQSDPYYIVLDVAHNEHAVQELVSFIQQLEVKGNIYAVCGMLQDKQIERCYELLNPYIDQWFLTTLAVSRGLTAEEFKQRIDAVANNNQTLAQVECFDLVTDAYINAKNRLECNDCLLVFGSFHTVGDIIQYEKLLVM